MTDTRASLYRRHRFPAEIIAEPVRLYFRFPSSFCMVEDMLAGREATHSHDVFGGGLVNVGDKELQLVSDFNRLTNVAGLE